MTESEVYKYYNNVDEVREYIEKYCKSRNVPLYEAVHHKVIHEYITYLLEVRKGSEQWGTQTKITKTTTNIACGVNES